MMNNFRILLFALLLSLVPLLLSAQSDNVSVSVSATVQGEIEMITINTMDFQNIGGESDILNINPIQSARAGKMVARGNPNAEFRLNYLRERELTNTEGTGVLIFNYEVSGSDVDEQDSSEMMDQEVRQLEFNGDGEFYLWIGGLVDLSNAEPGSYEGEFTIEIEYI